MKSPKFEVGVVWWSFGGAREVLWSLVNGGRHKPLEVLHKMLVSFVYEYVPGTSGGAFPAATDGEGFDQPPTCGRHTTKEFSAFSFQAFGRKKNIASGRAGGGG